MNNYSDSDDSDDENNELPPFSPDLLLDVPKQLQKVKFRLKSEPTTVAAGTNIILKEEEKLAMTDKLNTLFPEAAKIFADVSNVRPKDELVILNINVLAKALDKGIAPKELQTFCGGENKHFVERLYRLGLDTSSVKFANYLQSKE